MLALLVLVALCWGLNWPVNKLLLRDLPPLWAVALRSIVGTVALFVLCVLRRRLVMPKRADVPVILSVGVLHMTIFSALVGIGLQFVTAGRSIVLAYTTPLWVLPAAYLLLGERGGWPRVAGALVGLTGLVLLFDPQHFGWHDPLALYGNAMVLAAALFWAMSILYIRAHTWVTPPFELTFWQALVATVLLCPIAYLFEGAPPAVPSRTSALLLYGGVLGIAVAYWAITTVNRAVPSSTTSIGLLLVPVFGLGCAWLLLGESPDATLLIAAALILGGVALGTVVRAPRTVTRASGYD
ncbi:DMT family transporter [Pseudonocardia acaciae]|uniref:DMT family transporter n=1 Tax=Pseudonocardia acaciae TaxID=551276 RepID=UPI000A63ABE4|nr:DMT family transporter [Pseudonocardia acaciae]